LEASKLMIRPNLARIPSPINLSFLSMNVIQIRDRAGMRGLLNQEARL